LLAARYRVEVRDKEGKLVTVIEGDSKSFTMNFIKLLIASHYNQNDVPTFVIYNVAGSPLYTGYIQTPYVGVPWGIFNIDYVFYDYVPAIWLGSSSCPNPALANGPCGSPLACCVWGRFPFSPYFVSPTAPCYGIASCSPSLTEDGWAVTITDQWLNVSQSPVTVGSMALVSGVVVAVPLESSQYDPETSGGPASFITEPYAAIVDNLSPPVTVWPGFLLTVSYTIYFPV